MDKQIKLEWVRLIKTRLKECKNNFTNENYKIAEIVLKPLIDYGEEEEKRINHKFKEINMKGENKSINNKKQEVRKQDWHNLGTMISYGKE